MVLEADLRMSYSCVPVFATATGRWCTVIVFGEMVAALRCSFACYFQRPYISKMTPKYDSTEGSQLRDTANVGMLVCGNHCPSDHDPCIRDVERILGRTT